MMQQNGPDARLLGTLAGLASGLLLLAALGFQAAGYAPCELCILQRWPHLAAALLGGAAWVTHGHRAVLALGLVAAVLATGFAVYHSGVELGWWLGPQACTGGVGNIGSMSAADLMRQLQSAEVVRCDVPAWSMFGVTMANLNALGSAGLAAVWALALVRARPQRGVVHS